MSRSSCLRSHVKNIDRDFRFDDQSLAHEINASHGSADISPIFSINDSVSFPDLALYLFWYAPIIFRNQAKNIWDQKQKRKNHLYLPCWSGNFEINNYRMSVSTYGKRLFYAFSHLYQCTALFAAMIKTHCRKTGFVRQLYYPIRTIFNIFHEWSQFQQTINTQTSLIYPFPIRTSGKLFPHRSGKTGFVCDYAVK